MTRARTRSWTGLTHASAAFPDRCAAFGQSWQLSIRPDPDVLDQVGGCIAHQFGGIAGQLGS
jgi:hypothetical protein